MEIKLIRIANTQAGAFGVLMHNEIPFCVTLEKPWRFNERNISCIPEGFYNVIPHADPDHASWGMIFHVIEVPGRSAIWIHPANLESELRGCIAPGSTYHDFEEKDGVSGSKAALKELRGIVQENAFQLKIVNRF